MNRLPILLTGAAGRIGRALAHGLSARGIDLRLTDIAPFGNLPDGAHFAQEDLRDPAAAVRLCAGVGGVIHLAGHPNSRDWDVVQQLNIDPTRRLFQAAAEAGARRIVYASSIHVAGYAAAEARLTADMPYRPDGPYGLSKVMGEMMLRYVCDAYGCTGVALRICSYRPRPAAARELRTWLSPDDLVRLVAAALTANVRGFHAIWGLSANSEADVDKTAWGQIGYLPLDDASTYRAELSAAGVDVSLVSEWEFLGGAFALPARP